jgi:peptidoglycan/LPS O-acetylase OafA/YrhL
MFFFAGGAVQRMAKLPAVLLGAACASLATASFITLRLYGLNDASLLLLATSAVVFFAKLGETAFGGPLRPLAFLGNATYSSYLLHFPMQLSIVIMNDSRRQG